MGLSVRFVAVGIRFMFAIRSSSKPALDWLDVGPVVIFCLLGDHRPDVYTWGDTASHTYGHAISLCILV